MTQHLGECYELLVVMDIYLCDNKFTLQYQLYNGSYINHQSNITQLPLTNKLCCILSLSHHTHTHTQTLQQQNDSQDLILHNIMQQLFL